MPRMGGEISNPNPPAGDGRRKAGRLVRETGHRPPAPARSNPRRNAAAGDCAGCNPRNTISPAPPGRWNRCPSISWIVPSPQETRFAPPVRCWAGEPDWPIWEGRQDGLPHSLAQLQKMWPSRQDTIGFNDPTGLKFVLDHHRRRIACDQRQRMGGRAGSGNNEFVARCPAIARPLQ